jgi:hypothetical protein
MRPHSSRGAPLVPVMKPANLRYRDNDSAFRRLHGPRFRRVLDQGQVRPGLVIIRQERFHVPVQSGLVEDDHVIEAFSPDRADHAFHKGTFSRRPWSRKDLFDFHGSHIASELTAKDAVAVTQ